MFFGSKEGKRKVKAINKETLDLILEVSKDQYPTEFAGILRQESGVITEVLLLPGTLSGGVSAIFQLHMLPIDFSVCGTVHSHPSGSYRPSRADLALFSHFGNTHIITARPYTYDSWQAYNHKGEKVDLDVVED